MMRPSTPLVNGSRFGSVVMVDQGRGSHGVVLATGLGAIELADTILSPGAVLDAMRQVDAHAQHLNGDIRQHMADIVSSAEGQRFSSDWIAWFAGWTAWYARNRSGYGLETQAAYASGDLVAHIRQFASEYNALESRFTSITGIDPTYNPSPTSEDSWLGLPVAAWVGISAGVVALGFVAWTASSVSRFAPATRAMRGRRRR